MLKLVVIKDKFEKKLIIAKSTSMLLHKILTNFYLKFKYQNVTYDKTISISDNELESAFIYLNVITKS